MEERDEGTIQCITVGILMAVVRGQVDCLAATAGAAVRVIYEVRQGRGVVKPPFCRCTAAVNVANCGVAAPRREERSTYLSRAPQKQPQNSWSAAKLWRRWQADIPAVPRKLQQAGAATRMSSSSRHAEMAAMARLLRNPTA